MKNEITASAGIVTAQSADYEYNTPVSYTHLDVYKRQVSARPARVPQRATVAASMVFKTTGSLSWCGNKSRRNDPIPS